MPYNVPSRRTYESGTISTNLVGKGIPTRFVDLMENVSGVASFLRPACKTYTMLYISHERPPRKSVVTSVILFSVKPTRTLNSFILQGCAAKTRQVHVHLGLW